MEVSMSRRVFVALEDVRSAHNVGSIFRTADGAGVDGLYLIGTTSAPIDRFGKAQPDIAKTALGAQKYVEWEQSANVFDLINKLKKEKWNVVGIEQDKRAIRLCICAQ